MNRYLKIIINLIIFPILFIVVNASNINENIEVKKGFIDLSNIKYEKMQRVKLMGEWEFYNKNLYIPENFIKKDTILPAYVNVPDNWSTYIINGEKNKGTGYGTFRVKIILPEAHKIYGVHIPEQGTSYKLYIDGKECANSGVPGKNMVETKPDYDSQLVTFFAEETTAEIVLQLSNFHHRAGGVWRELSIGNYTKMQKWKELKSCTELFLVGSLLIMGFYHVGLYILRRREKSPLYFGLFCILIGIRILFQGEYLYKDFFKFIDWENGRKIEYIMYYMGYAMFSTFLYSLFPREFSKKFVYLVNGISIIFSLVVIATKTIIYSNYIIIFHFVVFITALFTIYYMVKTIRHGRKGAVYILLGFIAILAATINDILYSYILINTAYLVPMGLLILIFFQSFVLSIKFSNAFFVAEKLADENLKMYEEIKELNQQLEKKVEIRTIELKETIEKLKTTQENLVTSEKAAYVGKLAEEVAHELNSPLGAALTGTGLIRDDLKFIDDGNTKKSIDESLEIIEEGVKKAKQITENLLRYSKNDEYRIKKFDINQIVTDTINIIEKEVNNSGIGIKIELLENPGIWGKTNEIIQAFVNIVLEQKERLERNKIKNGVILIATSHNSNNVLVEICSNLEDTEIENEHFFLSEENIGTMGARIMIAYNILKENNCDIRMESFENAYKFIISFKKS